MSLISHLGVVEFLFFERVVLLIWKQDISLLRDSHLLQLVVGKEFFPIVLRGTSWSGNVFAPLSQVGPCVYTASRFMKRLLTTDTYLYTYFITLLNPALLTEVFFGAWFNFFVLLQNCKIHVNA